MRVSITLGLMFQLLQVRINPHTQTHIYTYNIIIYKYTHIYIHLKDIEKKHAHFWPLPIYTYMHACIHTYILTIYPFYIWNHSDFLRTPRPRRTDVSISFLPPPPQWRLFQPDSRWVRITPPRPQVPPWRNHCHCGFDAIFNGDLNQQ